jgi:hypothetical protein
MDDITWLLQRIASLGCRCETLRCDYHQQGAICGRCQILNDWKARQEPSPQAARQEEAR